MKLFNANSPNSFATFLAVALSGSTILNQCQAEGEAERERVRPAGWTDEQWDYLLTYGKEAYKEKYSGTGETAAAVNVASGAETCPITLSLCPYVLQVNVFTDYFGLWETYWDVTDSSGKVVASVDPGFYPDSYTSYTTEVCVDYCGEYTFTIRDTWGDGQDDTYGDRQDDGSYSVTVGGSTVASGGGDWGYSESTTFAFTAREGGGGKASKCKAGKTSKSAFATSFLVGNEMKSSASAPGGSSTLVALLAILALGANYYY